MTTDSKLRKEIISKATSLHIRYYKPPYNTTRRAKITLFTVVLSDYKEYQELSEEQKLLLADKIENSCYNTLLEKAKDENISNTWENPIFEDTYHSICARISSNIDMHNKVKNINLVSSILNGSINIDQLPKLSSQEIFPEKYSEIINKIELSKSASITVKTSSLYRCRRCHQNKCTIENRYNRSLDEGVNLTITCVACGNQWNA
jgi:DNA-directed RNA polymerase subunit M/transcription elongation factor TFIIS